MEYKSNSFKSKEAAKAEKHVTKVVSGTAKIKKKSEASKLKDVFISEEANNVKNYIFMDVLVPAIKKAVKDIVTDGIEMILYGETGRKTDSSRSPLSHIKYDKISDRDRFDDRTRYSAIRNSYDFGELVIESRAEAEEVLLGMDDILKTYGVVSVSDLYELVGVASNYTDNKYGWTNIRTAEVVRGRDGYSLKLPKAFPID